VAVTAGAFDAIERLLRAHLRTGDRVLVEDPVYSSIPDLVLSLGLIPVPVAIDDLGLLPGALRRALTRGAQAAVIIPRAQNPFGAAHDRERAEELRDIFATHRQVLLIEDDHAGEIAGASMHSLTAAGPEHWAVVRSASKTLHPDLRVAVVAGDETTIARVEGQQMLGARWVSHILQATVVELLRDPGFELVTRRARDTYARRRQVLLDALSARGITAHGRSGLNVWVPVTEEAPVIRALDEAGWVAIAGEPFRLEAPPGIRITTATLPEASAEEVAAVIAAAASQARPRRQY
jgi:DNA-binding transcriptional MocR family regulator